MKINVRTYSSFLFNANCYLISFSNSECQEFSIVIDPCVSYNKIKKDIKGKLKGVFITHGHFDHFKEIESYVNTDVLFYLHKKAIPKISNDVKNGSKEFGMSLSCNLSNDRFKAIGEGILNLNFQNNEKICIKIYETPGHTDCSLTFVIEDKMFTGDFIFLNSIGRTDLYTGSMIMMGQSINRFKQFKDDYIIYPGHDMCTTLEEEKKNSHYFK